MNAALCSRRVAGCSLLYRGEGRGGRGCKAREEGRKEAVEENVSGESFKLRGRGVVRRNGVEKFFWISETFMKGEGTKVAMSRMKGSENEN